MKTEPTVETAVYFHKPSLLVRVKSMVIDGAVLIGLMVLAAYILNALEVESGQIRGATLCLLFLYEPLLVWLDRTAGQAIMGLKVYRLTDVVDSGQRRNITLLASLVRYAAKLFLGWISLFTVYSDPYGQALHDKASESVMVTTRP